MLQEASSSETQKRGRTKMSGSKVELQPLVPALKDFSVALTVMAELAPDRLSLGQCVFFLYAGLADLAGKPATFTEIREAVGQVIGRSLHTTYKALLDEGRKRAGERESGAGWLMRETDASDNRRKYLRLTAKGRSILRELGVGIEHTRN